MGAGFIGSLGENDLAYAAEGDGQADGKGRGIAEINMKSAQLDELHRFYGQELKMPVTLDTDKLTVEAGSTRLVFSPNESTGDNPFYHYAFNIPENKIESARVWQKERTPLLRKGKTEIIHFSAINAHSVYFNDPAGNIVEYIARHDLNNSATGEFSQGDILYASEIGLVVDDVPQTATEVDDSIGLKYSRGYRSQSFTMVGDQHALLILVKRNRLWFPNKKQQAKVHPVEATVRGSKAGQLINTDLNYEVKIAPI